MISLPIGEPRCKEICDFIGQEIKDVNRVFMVNGIFEGFSLSAFHEIRQRSEEWGNRAILIFPLNGVNIEMISSHVWNQTMFIDGDLGITDFGMDTLNAFHSSVDFALEYDTEVFRKKRKLLKQFYGLIDNMAILNYAKYLAVTDGTKRLQMNRNYKVTFHNNSALGTAKATVTGIGGYYFGSQTVSFEIIASSGEIYKKGNLKYKVWNNSTDGKGTVEVMGMVKKKSSVSIPGTVKIGKYKYKVTSIAKKAFYKKKKVKKITISSTTIRKIGSRAVKGISKKARIKVPKKKRKSSAKFQRIFHRAAMERQKPNRMSVRIRKKPIQTSIRRPKRLL